jgi:hypothetical protein
MYKHTSSESTPIKQALVGSLSQRAIRRRMRSEALQHQATLLPLTVFFLCLIYLLMLSPILGGILWVIVLLVTSILMATTGFLWRYSFRYKLEYAKHTQKIMEIIDQAEKDEVKKLCQSLHFRFFNIGTTEGLKILNELVTEYELVQTALRRGYDTDPLFVAHIPILAREAFQRGLSILSDAIELIEAAGSMSKESLKKKVSELQNEIEASKKDKNQVEWLKIKEDRLAFYKQRFTILDQAQLRVEQLLFQAERCENSLHRTRAEVAAIRAGGSETNVDSAIQALEATIYQVKEVQEELRRLNY